MSSNFHSDGTLFIVSGPSGAGKTTLIDRVRRELVPLNLELHFSVSHTTRKPRSGEAEGVNYYYVDQDVFERMVERREFLEWARVHAHLYGTSRAEVESRLARGMDVVLDIDYQGAKLIAQETDLKSRTVNIFIFPPSLEILEQRLRTRGLNTDQEIDLRLRKALDEIDEGKGFYRYIIINDDLDVASECLKAAIIAEKLKTRTALEAIAKMAERFKEEHRNGRTAGRN